MINTCVQVHLPRWHNGQFLKTSTPLTKCHILGLNEGANRHILFGQNIIRSPLLACKKEATELSLKHHKI